METLKTKTMKSELVKFNTPELGLVEESKAKQIKDIFMPMAIELQQFDGRFQEIVLEAKNGITPELSSKAKRLRLDIVPTRVKIGKAKDKMKESLKLYDKAIMGVHNLFILESKEYENPLSEIEKHAEIQEQERLEKLQLARVKEILPYIEDAEQRVFSDMQEDVWDAYFKAKKKEFEDKKAAEKKAELDRIEHEKKQAAEREAQRIENIRLKKEAEKLEASIQAERLEREKAEKERLEKERIENDKREAKLKKESEEQAQRESKIQAENEAKLKKEREEKEVIQRELEAKIQAELNLLADAESAKQAELKKGDADKVKDLIKDLIAIKTKYTFKSKSNQKMLENVCLLIDKVLAFITK